MKDYKLPGFIIIVLLLGFFVFFGWEDYPEAEPPKNTIKNSAGETGKTNAAETALSEDYKIIWDKISIQSSLIFPGEALDSSHFELYVRRFIALNIRALEEPLIIGRALSSINTNTRNPDLSEAQKFWLDRLGANLSIIFTCQERLTKIEIEKTYNDFVKEYPEDLLRHQDDSLVVLLENNPCPT